MLDQKGFNQWASGYEHSVATSDEENAYPFAGYGKVLDRVFRLVSSGTTSAVLDIGFGAGTLTSKLYESGCTIWGQDFSDEMIAIAAQRMPNAHLFAGDFSKGLVPELMDERYDAIVSTYALHHLTQARKVTLLKTLLPLLKQDGSIIIGDVAFETDALQEACRHAAGDEWDDEEYYFVAEEMRGVFPTIRFEPLSFCAGVFVLKA